MNVVLSMIRRDQWTVQIIRFGLTTFLLFNQAVPRIYPQAPPLSQAFGA